MRFQDLTSQHWTNFWNELTPSIEQNDQRIKKYKWLSVRRSLTNVGVDKKIVDKAETTFNIFHEVERQVLRFNRFFVGNRDVLQECLGTIDINETFLKILELFEKEEGELAKKHADKCYFAVTQLKDYLENPW